MKDRPTLKEWVRSKIPKRAQVHGFFMDLNAKKLIVIFILAYSIMPLINVLVSKYITTYSYMAVAVVTVLYTILACKLRNVKELLLMMLPFVLFQLLQILVKQDPDVLLMGYHVVLYVLPLCLGYYMMYHRTDVKLYCAVLVICTMVTVVTTILGCLENPEAARTLATIMDSQDPRILKYSMMNLGGYSFVYSTVLMYPMVITAFKVKRLHIVITVIMTVLLFLLAINTQYSLALLLMMFSSVLYLVKKTVTPKRFAAIFITGAVLILVFHDLVTDLMTQIGILIGNDYMAEKMAAIFQGPEALLNLDDNRLERYLLSISAFFKSPLLGNLVGTKSTIGGHSFILDTLANYGLLGGVLMYMMYRNSYRYFIKPFADNDGYAFVVWTFFQTIFLSTVNTGQWMSNICFYYPLILSVIYRRDEKILPRGALARRPEAVPLIPRRDRAI